jgi:hypothetical protein
MIWEWPKIKCKRIQKSENEVVSLVTRKPFIKIILHQQHPTISGAYQHTIIIGKLTINLSWKT